MLADPRLWGHVGPRSLKMVDFLRGKLPISPVVLLILFLFALVKAGIVQKWTFMKF